MTANISHRYIESHWLVFVIQGLVALFFGSIALFTGRQDPTSLVAIASISLLTLGTIEFFNLLHRERTKHGFGFAAIIALAELSVALTLLMTIGQNIAWHVVLIAGYVLARGIFDALNALRVDIEATDRFAWLACGICGAVFGFAILNGSHLRQGTAFVSFFGAYLMISGLTNLFYGIHNRNEKLELLAERRLAAKQRRLCPALKSSKSSKSSKSTSKKSKTTKSQ